MQRILVVEDIALQTALKLHFRARRVHVGLAPSWPLALALARRQQPALIVCSDGALEPSIDERWQQFKERELSETRLLCVADADDAQEPLGVDGGCRVCAPDLFLETAVAMLATPRVRSSRRAT